MNTPLDNRWMQHQDTIRSRNDNTVFPFGGIVDVQKYGGHIDPTSQAHAWQYP